MKTNKINKIFILVALSIIVFAGATFEVHAFNWRDYVPNVSAWPTNFFNTLADYKSRFLAFLLDRKAKLEAEFLVEDKGKIIGSKNYSELLDRMEYFKEDKNRREICVFIQKFVENYLKASDQEKILVKDEYIVFNNRLKKLRDNDVSWFEIVGLNNIEYEQATKNSIDVWDAWASLQKFKKFNSQWAKDKSLDEAISMLEKKIV